MNPPVALLSFKDVNIEYDFSNDFDAKVILANFLSQKSWSLGTILILSALLIRRVYTFIRQVTVGPVCLLLFKCTKSAYY